MTQEQKAQAYDEALERFKAFKEKYYTKDTNLGDAIFDKTGEMQKDFESIFPESESERLYKRIEQLIRLNTSGAEKTRLLAYLEKQKEQEHICDSAQYEEGFKTGLEIGLRKQKEQKSAEWSEEDTLMLTAIIQTLERFGGRGTTGMQIDWLKSICPQPKVNWSEEDEDYMNAIITIINRETALYPKGGATEDLNNDLIAWLKSLRSNKQY